MAEDGVHGGDGWRTDQAERLSDGLGNRYRLVSGIAEIDHGNETGRAFAPLSGGVNGHRGFSDAGWTQHGHDAVGAQASQELIDVLFATQEPAGGGEDGAQPIAF